MPLRPNRRRKPTLQRWYLIVDLRSVVQVVVIPTRRRKAELNAVAAHTVVAREQSHVADSSDFTPRVGAAPHANDDLHDVPGHTPHHRVVRVVDQVALNRHDDQTVRLMADAIDLTEDPGDDVGAQVDVAMTASEASCRAVNRRACVKAPWRNPAYDRDLSTVLNRACPGWVVRSKACAGKADRTDQRRQRCQDQDRKSEASRELVAQVAQHPEAITLVCDATTAHSLWENTQHPRRPNRQSPRDNHSHINQNTTDSTRRRRLALGDADRAHDPPPALLQVGRVDGTQLGELGLDNAFGDDGRFHALLATPVRGSRNYEDFRYLVSS
jgi:hypothetical protein